MPLTNLSIDDKLPLLDSPNKIPRIGFGVYKSDQKVAVNSVLTAFKHGYRHVDSAQYYDNEKEVGEAVRQSGIPREEIFVTTKILRPKKTFEENYESVKKSVEIIGLGYVDLFLVHSPSSGPGGRKLMWTALEKLKDEGLVKDIGVSNYGVKHLEELKGYARYPIAINQIELHPWLQQRSVVEYCKKEGIVVEAYAPMVRGQKNDDPVVVELAKKHDKTPTQILLRWSLQKGFVPLPKSDHEERIKQNIDLYGFSLDGEDVAKLDALDLGEGGEGAICPYPVHCP